MVNLKRKFWYIFLTTNAWKSLQGPQEITPDSLHNSPIASRCALRHSASSLSWSRWYCSWNTHTHTCMLLSYFRWRWRLTRSVITSLVQCGSVLGGGERRRKKKKSSPLGGAPVLPATSPDAFDPPHGPTTSWTRRGWGMAPGAGDAQTESDMITVQHTNTHTPYVWTCMQASCTKVLTYIRYCGFWTSCVRK